MNYQLNMDAFLDRLRQLMGGERRGTWARRHGISSVALYRAIAEKKLPSHEQLAKIRAATGIALDWLLYGEGPMYRGKPDPAPADPPWPPPSSDEGYVAITAYREAGLSEVQTQYREYEQQIPRIAFPKIWLCKKGLAAEHLKLVVASGDSMAPTVPDGALLLVDMWPLPAQTLPVDGIYVISRAGGLLVKRLQLNFDKSVSVISDNAAYDRQLVRGESLVDLKIVGRVVWIGHEI